MTNIDALILGVKGIKLLAKMIMFYYQKLILIKKIIMKLFIFLKEQLKN